MCTVGVMEQYTMNASLGLTSQSVIVHRRFRACTFLRTAYPLLDSYTLMMWSCWKPAAQQNRQGAVVVSKLSADQQWYTR